MWALRTPCVLDLCHRKPGPTRVRVVPLAPPSPVSLRAPTSPASAGEVYKKRLIPRRRRGWLAAPDAGGSVPRRRGRRRSPRRPGWRRARCRRRRTRRAGWFRTCAGSTFSVPQRVTSSAGSPNMRRQVLRVEAQRLDRQVRRQGEIAALDRLHRLPPARVGQPEMHAHRMHPADRAVAQECLGRGEPDELDAFFLGVLHLAHRAGHVRPIAAIQALHRGRPLAHRGPHAVHRRVAAADHHDMLAACVQQAGVENPPPRRPARSRFEAIR